jgi:hypothetical protein
MFLAGQIHFCSGKIYPRCFRQNILISLLSKAPFFANISNWLDDFPSKASFASAFLSHG